MPSNQDDPELRTYASPLIRLTAADAGVRLAKAVSTEKRLQPMDFRMDSFTNFGRGTPPKPEVQRRLAILYLSRGTVNKLVNNKCGQRLLRSLLVAHHEGAWGGPDLYAEFREFRARHSARFLHVEGLGKRHPVARFRFQSA